jgi:hypothetical protein
MRDVRMQTMRIIRSHLLNDELFQRKRLFAGNAESARLVERFLCIFDFVL